MNMTDEKYAKKPIGDIIEGIKINDEAAYLEFYNRTYKVAYAIAFNMVKNEHDTMDILQDAYVTVYKKIGTLQQGDKAVSWFNMIVGNKCRDHLKKKKPTLFNELDTDEFEFEDTLENDNNEFIPEEIIDYSETKRLIQQILDELPEEQKLCTLMYYYEELSVKEIADSLECSENTVKSRLNYARRKIKDGILELEKNGTKLYGIAPIPFVVWMLKETENTYATSSALYGQIIAEVQAAGVAIGTTTATAVAGKSIATKIIIGVIVAVLAVGGITIGVKHFNNNTSSNATQETEEMLMASYGDFDERELKNLMYYLPIFDKNDPVTDSDIFTMILYSLFNEYTESLAGGEYDFPSVLDLQDVGMVVSDVPGEYDHYSVPGKQFDSVLKLLDYKTPINQKFFEEFDPNGYNLVWYNNNIDLVLEGFGGDVAEWSVEITNVSEVEDRLILGYVLTEYSYYYETSFQSFREMEIKLTDSGYVIKSIREKEGSTGALSVIEECNDIDEVSEMQSESDANAFTDKTIYNKSNGACLTLYFETKETILANVNGSNDFFGLHLDDENGTELTYVIVESSRPSGDSAPDEDMLLIYNYVENTIEIINSGDEFDGAYEVEDY